MTSVLPNRNNMIPSSICNARNNFTTKNNKRSFAKILKIVIAKRFRTNHKEQIGRTSVGQCSDDDLSKTEIDKTVTFCENVVCHRTMPLSEYTKEEIEASWYSNEDFRRIHVGNSKQIDKLNHRVQLKDKKYCSRGLEGATPIAQKARQQNRALACSTVLDLQARHREQAMFDDEAIAAVYRQASSSCQLWANVVGNRDERAVYGYLNI